MSHLNCEGARAGLPEIMASAQVPLTSTFPSGQVHLAPVGLSRHMKSQGILRHGLDAVETVKPSQEDNLSGWPQMRKTPLFVKCYLFLTSKAVYFSCFNFCVERCCFLEAYRGTGYSHTNNFTSFRLNKQQLWNVLRISHCLFE